MICLTFHCKLRRSVNRLSNPRVGSTAANICDLADYVRVGRARVLSQQCRGRHDLSWLTIPALRHIASPPGYLHRMLRVWRESFYSRDIFPGHLAYRLHARAHRLAIHVHRTRPAQRNSTPVLRSGQTNRVPDHPQQRCLWLHVYGVHLPINFEREHDERLPILRMDTTTPSHYQSTFSASWYCLSLFVARATRSHPLAAAARFL